MTIDQTVINDVIRRITSTEDVDRIILFGSAARGTMTPDSDVDLLVLRINPRNTREEGIRIRRTLRGLGVPSDIVVMSSALFEETKSVIGSIAYPAHQHGRVIYEAAL